MKILLFAGSLRKDSLNKKLVRVAESMLKKNLELSTTIIDLQILQLPVYDGDIEAQGIPESVQQLAKDIGESDLLVISSPEYNGSISSPLKNTIDWVSRVKPMTLTKKPVLLLGASPGGLGAMRALLHGKMPFEALGNFVYPQSFGLAHADLAFDEKEQLKDPAQGEKLQKLLTDFVAHGKKIS